MVSMTAILGDDDDGEGVDGCGAGSAGCTGDQALGVGVLVSK